MAGLMLVLQGGLQGEPISDPTPVATPAKPLIENQQEVRVQGMVRIRSGYTASNRPVIEKRGFELAVFRREGRISGGEVCVFPDGGFPRAGQQQCFLLSGRLMQRLKHPDEGARRSLAPVDPFAQQFLRVLLSEGNQALEAIRILGYDTGVPIQVEVRHLDSQEI